jgi:DeoR/GlpR family transcriptional regulator of sugar metabolism
MVLRILADLCGFFRYPPRMSEMLAAERRDLILETLRHERKVQATMLSARFGCSPDTIRRDLDRLATDGLVHRVHGGALPLAGAASPFAERREQDAPAKDAIARAAAALVADGMVVVLDGGSTCLHVAQHLPPSLRATIFVNAPPIAEALAQHTGVRVEMLGGRVNPHTMTTVGATTVAAISALRPDLCLLGPCALHPEAGITVSDPDEQQVKAAMVAAASQTVALATADKLGTPT